MSERAKDFLTAVAFIFAAVLGFGIIRNGWFL